MKGRQVVVEACVDAIDAALEAEWGGADRIELCGELLQGGVTPSAGLIEAVWDQVAIPVFVLVRPRSGDFLYSNDELDVMERDIGRAKTLHVDGVVVGALTTDGQVDQHAMQCLIDAARPIDITFHRAFDFTRDQDEALEALMKLGVDRVLTSGGAPTALHGARELARLVRHAGDAITIVAAGSITPSNVAEVVEATGVREVHVRGAERVESAMHHRRGQVTLTRSRPLRDYERYVARADEIRRIQQAVNEPRVVGEPSVVPARPKSR